MKWRRFLLTCSVLFALGLNSAARAAVDESDEPVNDARTEGYSQKLQIAKPSTSLVWLAFIALSVISLSAMFKDAKRTHLD